MKTTRYFEEQVVRKRPYLRREWIEAAVLDPLERVIPSDGRVRLWYIVQETGNVPTRYRRVVLLEDGETVHNAFFDRNCGRDR